MEEFSYKELQQGTKDFSLSHLIGKGSHGCVYKGTLGRDKREVAIKKPSLALQILEDNTKLENEIDVLLAIQHPNVHIVNSIGVSHDSVTHKKLLVMDFMPNGSLHDLLYDEASAPPSWSKRGLIALHVARAIRFLHESKPSIVHRDIKPSNILFDSSWNAKVADFGLAVQLGESNESDSLSQPAGTIGYIDPVYVSPERLSVKNDVYSFGVVLLEIVSCRRAIDVQLDPASVVDWALSLIEKGRMMDICDTRAMVPHNMERAIGCILNIAARCVSSNEKIRPTMREIVTELETCVAAQIVRFSGWKSVFRTISMRQKRVATRVTTIRCMTHEVEANDGMSSKKKLSIRDILGDVSSGSM